MLLLAAQPLSILRMDNTTARSAEGVTGALDRAQAYGPRTDQSSGTPVENYVEPPWFNGPIQ